MGHIANVTQQLRAIPPERFQQKLKRTAGGILLVALGIGMLIVKGKFKLVIAETVDVWYDRAAIAFTALGGVTASFEIIKAPVDYALAVAKTVRDLALGKNGATPPPASEG